MLLFGTFVFVSALLFGHLSKGESVKGAVQFRISETEFNKVASVLLQPRDVYKVNMNDRDIQGVYNGLTYTLTDLNEKSKSQVVHMQIPSDGEVNATAFSSVIQHIGKLKLTRLNGTEVIYDGHIDVSLTNVTLQFWGDMDISSQIVPSNNLLPIDFSNCSAQTESISINDKVFQDIGEDVTRDDLMEIFQSVVCQVSNGKFLLGFGESEVAFTIIGKPIIVRTCASSLEIKNKAVIITQKVKTSFKKDKNLPPYNPLPPPSFPLPDASSQPFEIVLQAEVFNELFREFKKELRIGVKPLPLAQLLPNLKDIAELETEGMYMNILFPMVGKKYPDAIGTMIVSDADIYFTVNNGSVQMHFDIAATLSVTLNCDKTRTYTALNFAMNLFFPVQLGYDNENLTMKMLSFGGNFTVLDSNVGHVIAYKQYNVNQESNIYRWIVPRVISISTSLITVIDRGLMSLLYAAPYYASGSIDKLNDMFQGIPLHYFLPKDIFALVNSVTVKENTVTIGGNLSPTDPQLPKLEKDQIKWAGKVPNEDDLFLLGRDRTPENPDGFELKEENCKKPPEPTSSASNVIYSAGNAARKVVPLCFMAIILHVW